jgi:anaerobic selenocysteine-containing dehydrogenase
LRRLYPLELITPKTDDGMNSSFGYRPGVDEAASVVSMHEADAAARNIASGDRVRVFNSRGGLTFTAAVDGAVPPGVVRAASVRWNRRSSGQRNANVLVSDGLTDIGGGPVFYSCLVEVQRCAD